MPDTTTTIVYSLLALAFILMARMIIKKGQENRKALMDAAAPKIAGEDELEGGAKNPEQFDEPDDEALDEMAKLLGEDEEIED